LHAILWQYGQMIDLGASTLGGPNSFGVGVNSAGVVGGEAETADADSENFCAFQSGLRCVPTLWQDGLAVQLPTLGGPNGAVSTVNNAGVAVGVAQTGLQDSSCIAPVAHRFEAVVWGRTPGDVRVLRPLPGDTVSAALWINDRGQAVGTSGSCSNTVSSGALVGPHAVLWDSDGTPIDLGSLGGTVDITKFAFGNSGNFINNKGAVVGSSVLADNSAFHAFLWTQDSGMKDLGILSGDVSSGGLAVNNRNEAVGASNDSNGGQRAFLWRNGLMSDLNTLVSEDAPLYLLVAFGINDRGEIVGLGATEEGDVHAYLATPSTTLSAAAAMGKRKPLNKPATRLNVR
jgi:probable HAF family extracellular repeat protein